MTKKKSSKGIVKTIHIAGGKSGEKIGSSFGRAIDEMIKFIRDRRLVAMEIVAETHSFPGRTDRLIVHLPKLYNVSDLPRPSKGNALQLFAVPRHDRRRGGRRR